MTDTARLKEFLSSPRKIVITTHHKPDGDALGSSLALYMWLKKQNHEVTIVSPTDYPDFLLWMPNEKEVINYEKRPNHSVELIQRADIFFCLDFNKPYRSNDVGKLIGETKTPKVLIDHHLDPDHFADYEFWNTKACSTAELVYEFFHQMDGIKFMDKDIASCIYAGMLTDTNSFTIPTTTARVHWIVADLIDAGINHSEIYGNIYETFTENKLRLLGFSITERMEIFNDISTGIICLDGNDLKKFNVGTGDTEGIVNYPLKMGNVKLAVLIIQRPDQVKLSMRSKGDIDVNKLCHQHFEGGGHKNAAGGKSNFSVEETKKQLLTILADFFKSN